MLNFYEIKIKNLKINANDGNCEDIVNIVRSSGNITEYVSNNARSDSLDLDFSEIIIENLLITNAINDCADFSSGKYMIINAQLKKCGDKGISVGEKSFIEINKLEIENSRIGLASKDSSITKINKSFFKNVETCLAAYNKKEFDGGYIEYIDNECLNSQNKFSYDKISQISIKKIKLKYLDVF